MVAGSKLTLDDARRDALGYSLRRQYVVQPPADIPLFHVAPRRPPREELRVVRLQRSVHVNEPMADDSFDEGAFFWKLPDRARFALFRMDVHVCPRHIEVAAQHERA